MLLLLLYTSVPYLIIREIAIFEILAAKNATFKILVEKNLIGKISPFHGIATSIF